MAYDLIIYDCDGTLVDTHVAVNQAFLDTLAKHGYTQFDLDFIDRECLGLSVPNLMKRLSQEVGHDIPDVVIPEYQLLVPEYLSRYVQADAEQIEVVSSLGQVYKQCVASNGLLGNVKASLDAAGLSQIFSEKAVFVSSQVPRPKPHPDLLLHAAKVMGAKKAVVIEDSSLGVEAGVAAGMDVIGYVGLASNSNEARASLMKAGAVQVFDTWPDIAAAIRLG